MKQFSILLLALGAMSCGAVQLPAQHYGPVHNHNSSIDRYRNSLWPMPFRSQDTCSVLTYFELQRNKGWQLANTLGTHCFDPMRNVVSEAGYAHIESILRKAPPDRRVIFVLRGADDAQTRKRIEATQVAVSRLVPTGTLPELYVTSSEPLGSSGAYQTAVHRAIMETVPPPRLPPDPNAGTNGSSSGQ